MEETFNTLLTNTTKLNDSLTGSSKIGWQNILMGVGLYCIVFVTIAGNILVLVAFYKEKKLRTVFNLYIVNLAVTDIGVAATAMSFYIIDNILGYWPFGEFLCGIWIFCDYGMTFASVFTLIVISVDRFWSVSWSLHYRTHHKAKKAYICIAAVWITMTVLWLPACVTDRIWNATHGVCIWKPSLNTEYVIVIATVGHHGFCIVLLFCYIQVVLFIRKRAKIVPVGSFSSGLTSSDKIDSPQKSPNPSTTTMKSRKEIKVIRNNPETVIEARSIPDNLQIPKFVRPKAAILKTPNDGRFEEARTVKRERKVFVTLSYIIVGYIICWVPFHIVFDISSLKPDAVPPIVYTITFWMTYLNSTINPILYNFSSTDFRDAFKKIILRRDF